MLKRRLMLTAVLASATILSVLYTNMSGPLISTDLTSTSSPTVSDAKESLTATTASVTTTLSRAALSTRLNIYLSPTGSDTKDGLSPTNAILSLNRAHQIATSRFRSAPTDIQINIAPGVYYNQSVTWTATHPDFYVIFKATNPTKKPVFDGRLNANQSLGEKRSFFTLKKVGAMTNVTFQDLSMRYYTEAISLSGNREEVTTGFNGNNKILSCSFDRIGSLYNIDQTTPGYAVVRLSNSRQNQIRGNSFTNIKNRNDGALLHALYISSHSSHNTIEGNSFINHGGDPIRIRDFSNFNIINVNEFNRAGSNGYSEWFCEKASEPTCTKVDPECPSWGNIFTRNIVKTGGLFTIYISPNFNMAYSACKRPSPPEAQGKRLRTAYNNASKVLVKTVFEDKTYFGACDSLSQCANASSVCYNDGKGSPGLLCSARTWHRCTRADVGKTLSGVTCQKVEDSYRWVY